MSGKKKKLQWRQSFWFLPEHGTTARKSETICRSNNKWKSGWYQEFSHFWQSYNQESCNHVYSRISRLTCKCSAGLFHTFSFLFHPIKKRILEADKSQKDAINKSSGAPTVLHMHFWPVHPQQQSLWYKHLEVIYPHIYQKPDPADWVSQPSSKDPSSKAHPPTSIIVWFLITSAGLNVGGFPARCRSAWVNSRFWKALCLT